MTKDELDAIRERVVEGRRLWHEGWTKDVDDVFDIADTLLAEIDALRQEIATDDKLLAEHQRILDAEPCATHGPCVPHVLEVLAGQKDELLRLRPKAEAWEEFLRFSCDSLRGCEVGAWTYLYIPMKLTEEGARMAVEEHREMLARDLPSPAMRGMLDQLHPDEPDRETLARMEAPVYMGLCECPDIPPVMVRSGDMIEACPVCGGARRVQGSLAAKADGE